MAETRLIISYSLRDFDVCSVDAFILGALGRAVPDGSGVGFGRRDLEFDFATKADAERARQRVEAAGLPVPLEINVWKVSRG